MMTRYMMRIKAAQKAIQEMETYSFGIKIDGELIQ